MKDAITLHKKCKTLFDALIVDDMTRTFFGPMQTMADSALEKGNQGFLKRIFKELLELARDFPKQVTPEVLASIGEKPVDLREQVAGIMKRGKIRNADEFHQVNEIIDHMVGNEEMRPIVDSLNKLLVDFEQRQ